MYHPLLFSSADPEIDDARGMPVCALSVTFMVLLAITVSASLRVVGVLPLCTLAILQVAAAQQLTAQPGRAILFAVLLAVAYVWVSLVVGFYMPDTPSFFINALAFLGLRVRAGASGPS